MGWFVWVILVIGCGIGLWLLWESWRSREVHTEPPPARVWSDKPAPGEIWWGTIPFARGFGSKDRPCVVVRTHAESVRVLMITSQDKSHRSDYVLMSGAGTGQKAGHDRWVDVSGLISVSIREMRKREGRCDERTWSQVTRAHRPGWAYKVSLDRRSWWDPKRQAWSPLVANPSGGRHVMANMPRERVESRPRALDRDTDVGHGLHVRVERGGRILIVAVNRGSAAEQAGLRPGFVITRLGGYSRFAMSHLRSALDHSENGVQLTVRRKDGHGGDLTVTLPH
jgi:hypothetical protein